MKRITAKAFTLVELLIVIALLGVIATIVIAAINPIEQANRSRDAGMKADASQLVSALQRYYTGFNNYPWTIVDVTNYADSDSILQFTDGEASNQIIGLCESDTTCATGGELVTANEMQIAFLTRKFITATSETDMLYVGKGSGASSSVFVCWVPKSNSARQNAIANNKVVDLSSAFTDGGSATPTYTDNCDSGPTNDLWSPDSGMPTCAECVPE